MINFWTVKVIRFVTIFFVIAVIIASYFYPGGNIHDSTQLGYSFTHNFLSDLGGLESHSGEGNIISSIFFNLSMLLFFLIGISFLFVPILFKENKPNFILAIIGSSFFFIGSMFFAGVGFTPYDVFFDLHVFFANNIFHCFLITSFFYSIVIFDTDILEKRYAFGYLVFFISILLYVGVLQFGPSVSTGKSELIFQVVAQKLIVIVFFITVFHQTFGLSKLQID